MRILNSVKKKAVPKADRLVNQIRKGGRFVHQMTAPRIPKIPYDCSIVERFQEVVDNYGTLIAVKDRDQSLTYRRLDAIANQVAHLILEKIDRPATIAVMLGHNQFMIESILGILKAGMAYVPLDLRYPADILKYMLFNSEASLLITHSDNTARVTKLTGNSLPILFIDQMDDDTPDHTPKTSITPHQTANIIYTSGTHTFPKGIRHTHRSIMRAAADHAEGLNLNRLDGVLLLASCSFSMSVIDIFATLLTGAGLFMFDIQTRSMKELFRWINQNPISIYHSTPTVFAHFLHGLDLHKQLFPGIRLVKMGGEPVPRRLFQNFKRHFPADCLFMNGYGLSEILAVSQYILPASANIDTTLIPIGTSTPGVDIFIADENGHPIGHDEPGEIVIKSSYFFTEYQGDAELTKQKLLPLAGDQEIRVFHTGDMGKMSKDGCISHMGRKDRQVKIQGVRVEIRSVEEALLSHPAIIEAMVRPYKYERGLANTQLDALVVTEDSMPQPSATQLKQYLKKYLPLPMIPSSIHFLEDLPKTITGKLDRKINGNIYCFVPKWYPVSAQIEPMEPLEEIKQEWLVFVDEHGILGPLFKVLPEYCRGMTIVRIGEGFKKITNSEYTINPTIEDDYRRLFETLAADNRLPDRVLHLWNLHGFTEGTHNADTVQECLEKGFYSLIYIARYLGYYYDKGRFHLDVITRPIFSISGAESIHPPSATILGPVLVIPLEYPHISCRLIDTPPEELHTCTPGKSALFPQLLKPITARQESHLLGFRDNQCYTQSFKPLIPDPNSLFHSRLKIMGVYLITAGLGEMGLEMADYISQAKIAKLILMDRTPFPPRDQWNQWLNTHNVADATSIRIRRLREIEKTGSEVLTLCADPSNPVQLENALDQAYQHFGRIQGVIHADGETANGSIALKSREVVDKIMAPKISGTLNLTRYFSNTSLDFFVLFSSINACSGKVGQVVDTAANAFMDAYARSLPQDSPKRITISINWDTWRRSEMTDSRTESSGNASWRTERLQEGLLPQEGVTAFEHILNFSHPQVIVSRKFRKQKRLKKTALNPRRQLELFTPASYQTPTGPTEIQLINIWEKWLNVSPITINDNFFELGGDSMKAMQISAEFESMSGRTLSVANLFHAPTVKNLAAVIQEKQTFRKWKHLVPLRSYGLKAPFFCVHNMRGEVWGVAGLRSYMPAERPLYALQAAGLEENERPMDSIPQMAAAYLKEIILIQPEGPYYLGGRCFGAIVAFEMAQQLIAQGKKVSLLVVLDGAPPKLRGKNQHAFGAPPGGIPPQMPGTETKITKAHLKAANNYITDPYPGKILLIGSIKNKHFVHNWAAATTHALHYCLIPCPHVELLKEPYVIITAEHLNNAFTGILPKQFQLNTFQK